MSLFFKPIFASHAGSIRKSIVLKTYKQVYKEKGRAPNYTAGSLCPYKFKRSPQPVITTSWFVVITENLEVDITSIKVYHKFRYNKKLRILLTRLYTNKLT